MIPTIANIRKAIYCLNKRIDLLEGGEYSNIVTELSNKVHALESLISEDLLDPTSAIDKFNEIVAFLNSIQNTDTLSGLLLDIISLIPDALIQSDWNQTNNKSVDFIKNKPTIPAAQILSDWNQSDNSQLDFIKNKPSIIERSEMGEANGVATLDEDGHLEAEQLEGDYPNSVSGNVVGEFSDFSEVSFRPTAGAVDVNSGKAGKGAKLMSIKGNTVAWNQIATGAIYAAGSGTSNVSIEHGVEATTAGNYIQENPSIRPLLLNNHKYIFSYRLNDSSSPDTLAISQLVIFNNSGGVGQRVNYTPKNNSTNSFIFTVTTNVSSAQLQVKNDTAGFSVKITYIQTFDLTIIYGVGNEPTTVEQFEADYERWFGKPLSYEEYDEGSLRPVLMQSVKTTGFNQWDEDWESGYVNLSDGENKPSTNSFRSKNFIPVLPNKVYNFYCSSLPSAIWANVVWYDSNHEFITGVAGKQLESPSNARYAKFYMPWKGIGYPSGNTYNHDICINLSHSGARDGEYEPYWTSVLNVPVTTLKGKLNGEGSSVVVFPGGMKKAGTVYDEIVRRGDKTYAIKRVGSVDLGTLNWVISATSGMEYRMRCLEANYSIKGSVSTSYVPNLLCAKYQTIAPIETEQSIGISYYGYNKYIFVGQNSYTDPSAFQTAMLGVMLYYELATPEEYLLDDFELPQDYDVDDYGTEEVQLGTNGCAPILDLKYGINAGDTIKNLPHNYVSAVGEQSFTEAQKARARKNIGAVSEEELESKGFAKIWRGTLAEYDLISTPDDNTIYIITPDLP